MTIIKLTLNDVLMKITVILAMIIVFFKLSKIATVFGLINTEYGILSVSFLIVGNLSKLRNSDAKTNFLSS